MNKYTVYRSAGELGEDYGSHDLVTVEYGKDIHAAENALAQAITEDIESMEEYGEGYTVSVDAPVRLDAGDAPEQYKYMMSASIESEDGGEYSVIEYGIFETED